MARLQTERVVASLKRAFPETAFELCEVVTEGDAVTDRRLVDMGGRGVFVKAIEDRLLGRSIDLAVHSCKDLPSQLPAGLSIAAVPERADARDVLISQSADGLEGLRLGARVGTGSPRREAQLRVARPDLQFHSVRGNLGTRLDKLASGEAGVEALVLAAAGLERLGWIEPVEGRAGRERGGAEDGKPEASPLRWPGGAEGWWAVRLPVDVSLPAVGQGALAVESRVDDAGAELAKAIDHPLSRAAVTAERGFLVGVRGGCHTPVGAHAEWVVATDGEGSGLGRLVLTGVIAAMDGSDVLRDQLATKPSSEPPGAEACHALGKALAERLLSRGGSFLLGTGADGRG